MSKNTLRILRTFGRTIFPILISLTITSAYAYADAQNPDGNDWNKGMTMEKKIGYLHGFIDGANGVMIGIFAVGDTPNKKLSGYVLTGMTLQQMIDGLDSLYADFKNRNIPLVFAIYVVNKQIKGTSSNDIERILLWLRSGGNRKYMDDYLTIKDSYGNIVRTIIFP